MERAPVEPELYSRRLAEDVVYTCMRGQVTRRVCADGFEEFREVIAGMEYPRWLIDALKVPSYHADAVPIGFQYFQHYRAQSGKAGVFACDNRVTLMAKNLISNVTGVKLADAKTLEEACGILAVPLSCLDELETTRP